MLNMSSCLGNYKPQIVVDVETAIWKTLFSLASGAFHPLDLLQRFSDNLPWDGIHIASSRQYERTWFNPGKFHFVNGYILLTCYLGAPLLPEILSSQPFAHIEVLPSTPRNGSKNPQTFEYSLALSITHTLTTASTSPPPTVDPSLLSFDDNQLTGAPFDSVGKPSASLQYDTGTMSAMDVDVDDDSGDPEGQGEVRQSPGPEDAGGEQISSDDSRASDGMDLHAEARGETPQTGLVGHDEDTHMVDEIRMDSDYHGPPTVIDNEEEAGSGSDGSDHDAEKRRPDNASAVPHSSHAIRFSDRLRSQAPAEDTQPNDSDSVNRPPKRRRVVRSSPESDSDEDDVSPSQSNSSGTSANPIDVDLYASIWQPTILKEFVSRFHWSSSIVSHSFDR